MRQPNALGTKKPSSPAGSGSDEPSRLYAVNGATCRGRHQREGGQISDNVGDTYKPIDFCPADVGSAEETRPSLRYDGTIRRLKIVVITQA